MRTNVLFCISPVVHSFHIPNVFMTQKPICQRTIPIIRTEENIEMFEDGIVDAYAPSRLPTA